MMKQKLAEYRNKTVAPLSQPSWNLVESGYPQNNGDLWKPGWCEIPNDQNGNDNDDDDENSSEEDQD